MTEDQEKILIEMVMPQIDSFRSGDMVVCKAAFPEDYWKEVTKGTRRTLGRWLSFLVAKGCVPLEPDGLNSKRNNKYRKL